MHRFLTSSSRPAPTTLRTRLICRAVSPLGGPAKRPSVGCTRRSSSTSRASWKTSSLCLSPPRLPNTWSCRRRRAHERRLIPLETGRLVAIHRSFGEPRFDPDSETLRDCSGLDDRWRNRAVHCEADERRPERHVPGAPVLHERGMSLVRAAPARVGCDGPGFGDAVLTTWAECEQAKA